MVGLAPSRQVRRFGSIGRATGAPFRGLSRTTASKSDQCCPSPKIEDIGGQKVCSNCACLISENNIVSEVTFGETASGGAKADGQQVHEGQTHANTIGAAAAKRLGATTRTREDHEQNGRDALRTFTAKLPIPQRTVDEALYIWKLAANDGFTKGRRAEEVAGACLYAACRRDKHNTVLLMDFAEIISINVFALGDTYKALTKGLYLGEQKQHMIEVEPLILKYAAKLEFGEKTRQVAEDAVKIIRRMKRDWIVTGRHPAGLCGACIILAARMNNFRRTVREVVFVVKVADLTIAKRLEEFKRTRSSFLTVDQFRSVGNRIKEQHDPPAVYDAKERARKISEKKRKRAEYEQNKANPIEIGDNESQAGSRQSSITPVSVSPQPETQREASQTGSSESQQVEAPPPAKKPRKKTTVPAATQREIRRDADGFAIPNLPIDPALLAAANAAAEEIANEDNAQRAESVESTAVDTEKKEKRKPGRPRKDKMPEPSPLTEEDLLEEDVLQDEIETILRSDGTINQSMDEIERETFERRTKDLAEQQRQLAAEANAKRAEQSGRNHYVVPDSEVIGEDEFADDPEVQNALLTEEQVKVKEMIWVAHNEDWLRLQQTKQLKRAMDEAEGKAKDKTKRRKRSRMGDGSVLEGGTPVESPADANRRMIEKRATKNFSQRVNYAALGRIYNSRSTPAPSESGADSEAGDAPPQSRAASLAPSEDIDAGTETTRVALPTPPTTQQQPAGTEKATVAGQPEEEDDEEDDPDDYWNEDDDQPDAVDPDEDENDNEEADFTAAQEDMTGEFGFYESGGEDY